LRRERRIGRCKRAYLHGTRSIAAEEVEKERACGLLNVSSGREDSGISRIANRADVNKAYFLDLSGGCPAVVAEISDRQRRPIEVAIQSRGAVGIGVNFQDTPS
jgi:hypothetical protein